MLCFRHVRLLGVGLRRLCGGGVAIPQRQVATCEDATVVGFVGLGAMGYHMAGHMARAPGFRCLVWNRTKQTAEKHALEYNSRAVAGLADLSTAKILVFCLPTSAEDVAIAEELAPHLSPGACLVSCTSGEPAITMRLAAMLQKQFGVHLLDCPVSGGPRGAAGGSLTCMLGSDDASAAERILPVIQTFSKKVVRCGPTGSAHAVKAINNALNSAHLLLGAEGLLTLQRIGVDPEVALEAINSSSGRSLQTEVRLPEEVLSRRFAYGFKLPLMAKDCRIAKNMISESVPGLSLLAAAAKVVEDAAQEEADDADYTRIVCHLERSAGSELHPKQQTTTLMSSSIGASIDACHPDDSAGSAIARPTMAM